MIVLDVGLAQKLYDYCDLYYNTDVAALCGLLDLSSEKNVRRRSLSCPGYR